MHVVQTYHGTHTHPDTQRKVHRKREIEREIERGRQSQFRKSQIHGREQREQRLN